MSPRVLLLVQVTTVELRDLPGCTVKTLAQCSLLQHVSMTHCSLVTTDGLEQCKQLAYVDLQVLPWLCCWQLQDWILLLLCSVIMCQCANQANS